MTSSFWFFQIEANWDTSSMDRNFKLDLTNKFSSTSRRLTSEIDIDITYTGISRGFSSNMDWQTDSCSHKLTFGKYFIVSLMLASHG